MNKTATAQQAKSTSLLPPAQGLLQRKCTACGNRTAAGGECTECAKKKHNLQRKLSIGASNDPLEHEADRVADQVMSMQPNATVKKATVRIQRYSGQTNQGEGTAPASVDHVLSSAGRPLEPSLRNDMEQRFGHDFSHVRVHTDSTAEQSARDVNANAYTVGNNVVFGAGQFSPQTQSGQRLLAHELTHVMQQSRELINHKVQRQVVPTASAGTQPRMDVVYVMGSDGRSRNRFFETATRYFRARIPNATFVTNIRNLQDLLTHLGSNFTSPLGNIYIITHANEDGTLSFGLNSTDRDSQLTAVELRNALSITSGAVALSSVARVVDRHTHIKIKGCDLGRNQQIVELLDQAFGGEGDVTAPTHEQGYQFNTGDIRTATTEAMNAHIHEFEEELEPIPAAPARVDRALRGDERREATRAFNEATRARRTAQRERREAIAAERRLYASEASRIGEEAGTDEYLSGPMFQRQGASLFTETEIQAEVSRLYPHLSATQHTDLVTRLIAPDRRASRLAHRQGTFQQQGQRAYRYEVLFSFVDPITAGQIQSAFQSDFSRDHFALDSFTMVTRTTGTATIHDYSMTGHDSRRGRQSELRRFSGSSSPVESDAALIQQIQAQVNNPDKFRWTVESRRSDRGVLTKKVVRERVVAYLHHGSLNTSSSEYFVRPESDRRFYAHSTYAPPSVP